MRNDAFIPAMRRGQVEAVQPRFVELVVPAFSYDMLHDTPSILAEYPLTNLVNISIRRPMPEVVRKATTYCLAVRSINPDDVVVRYILHRPAGFYGLLYPDYNGETIFENAANLEVWGIPAEDTAESAGFTLYSGPFVFANNAFGVADSAPSQGAPPPFATVEWADVRGRPEPMVGPQGPPGQDGLDGASVPHTILVGFTNPDVVWTHTHNLGMYPTVTVLDTNMEEVFADKKHLNVNTVQVTFALPATGYLLLTY